MMWLIYLIGVADSVEVGLQLFAGIFFTIAIIFFVASLAGEWAGQSHEEDLITRKKCRRFFYVMATFFTLFMCGACLFPSSNTIAAMYLIPKIAENQQLQQVSDKGIKLLNLKLDDWIKEASDKS